MAANMTGMRVEGTMVVGTGARRGRGHGRRDRGGWFGRGGPHRLLVGGVALHDRGASHPAAPAIPRVDTRAETRFLENNTTNLPNAVTANVGPDVNRAERGS